MQSGVLNRRQSGLTDAAGYLINEMFYSLQGEGLLAGVAMVFVRFAKCNLRCSAVNAGFDCDTTFEAGWHVTSAAQVVERVEQTAQPAAAQWVLLTGGEPGLQVDPPLLNALREAGYRIAIETNGTCHLPDGIDHICVSPKSAWHTIKVRQCHELKMVRQQHQAVPCVEDIPVKAGAYLVSPSFEPDGSINRAAAAWCINHVKENPAWRLSLQVHKMLRIR